MVQALQHLSSSSVSDSLGRVPGQYRRRQLSPAPIGGSAIAGMQLLQNFRKGERKEMSNSKTEVKNTGIGFSGLLAVAFIVLKLMKVIDWSWWWVLAPLWIPVAIYLFILFVIVVVAVVKEWRG